MPNATLQRSTVTETSGDARSAWTLAAALLGFFVVTFDVVVVNVALPSIRDDFGGGISGLQWLVDGYTLMFAGLLLTSGALATVSALGAGSASGLPCSSRRRSLAGWRRRWVCWSSPGSCRARRRRS